jgi:peptidyl-prolyl cis-trans isomerase A (cyclophilin A)
MFQFGIHGDPAVSAKWRDATIKDDKPAGVSNRPGYLSFAKGGRDSRTTQIFINLGDNRNLDSMGFTPFGQVVEGSKTVLNINTEYGENAGDVQGKFQSQGNSYILKKYPNLDIIKSVTFVTDAQAPQVPAQPGQPKE